MKLFPCGHAAHPDWRKAAEQVLVQLRAQMQLPDHASAPTLGLLYITDHYAGEAQELLDHLSAELPEVTDWSGTVGVGVCAGDVEYFDAPALALMLLDVPSDQTVCSLAWRPCHVKARATLSPARPCCTPTATRPTSPS